MVRQGDTFTHLHMLDPGWKPGPGQRYVDAPKARCQVTRVTATTVYFGYAGSGTGGWSLNRRTFEATYGWSLTRKETK